MYGTSNFTDKIVQAAAPDALQLKMSGNANLPRGGSMHPVADELNLLQIAAAFNPRDLASDYSSDRMHRATGGVHTAEFGMVISAAANAEFQIGYNTANEFMEGVRVLEVENYRPHEARMTDGGLSLELLPENAKIKQEIQKVPNGEFVILNSYSKAAFMSMMEIINDDASILADTARATGVTTARTHSNLIAEKLESNPVLRDGLTTFIQGQNDLAGQVLSLATLGTAMSLLRSQQSPNGSTAGNKAAILFCSGSDEAAAYSILKESGLALKIICLPALPDGRWYLTASPSIAPTIVTGRLKGDKSFLHCTSKYKFNLDGLKIDFSMTTCAAIVSRVGIVRAGGVAPVEG